MKARFPSSAADAFAMLADEPEMIPLAGGTDLLVHWPDRHEFRDRTYLDLGRVAEFREHRWTEDALVIGATTTYWDLIRDPRTIEELPLLVEAGRLVGAVQIQSRGTWAGNIVNASPAADGVPVLMAYDAVLVLESAAGREEVPLSDFYLGYKEMRRSADQLVRQIRVPLAPRRRERFDKVGSRRAQAIAKVGLATLEAEDGWRVVAASLAPTVRRCRSVERLLDAGSSLDSPSDLLPALRSDVSPIDDIRSTAEYREQVAARILFYGPGGGTAGEGVRDGRSSHTPEES
ncbi:MAG: FAD binding domain-containing protein [Gemmatimonadota bacterium]